MEGCAACGNCATALVSMQVVQYDESIGYVVVVRCFCPFCAYRIEADEMIAAEA